MNEIQNPKIAEPLKVAFPHRPVGGLAIAHKALAGSLVQSAFEGRHASPQETNRAGPSLVQGLLVVRGNASIGQLFGQFLCG